MKKVISFICSLALISSVSAIPASAVSEYTSDNIPVLSTAEGLIVKSESLKRKVVLACSPGVIPCPIIIRVVSSVAEMEDDKNSLNPALYYWVENDEKLFYCYSENHSEILFKSIDGYNLEIVGSLNVNDDSTLTVTDYNTMETSSTIKEVCLSHNEVKMNWSIINVETPRVIKLKPNGTSYIEKNEITDAVIDIANSANVSEQSESVGDINSDGKTDITDLSELSLALVGDKVLTEAQQKAADVDGDGAVKLADLAKYRQYLSKVISSLG